MDETVEETLNNNLPVPAQKNKYKDSKGITSFFDKLDKANTDKDISDMYQYWFDNFYPIFKYENITESHDRKRNEPFYNTAYTNLFLKISNKLPYFRTDKYEDKIENKCFLTAGKCFVCQYEFLIGKRDESNIHDSVKYVFGNSDDVNDIQLSNVTIKDNNPVRKYHNQNIINIPEVKENRLEGVLYDNKFNVERFDMHLCKEEHLVGVWGENKATEFVREHRLAWKAFSDNRKSINNDTEMQINTKKASLKIKLNNYVNKDGLIDDIKEGEKVKKELGKRKKIKKNELKAEIRRANEIRKEINDYYHLENVASLLMGKSKTRNKFFDTKKKTWWQRLTRSSFGDVVDGKFVSAQNPDDTSYSGTAGTNIRDEADKLKQSIEDFNVKSPSSYFELLEVSETIFKNEMKLDMTNNKNDLPSWRAKAYKTILKKSRNDPDKRVKRIQFLKQYIALRKLFDDLRKPNEAPVEIKKRKAKVVPKTESDEGQIVPFNKEAAIEAYKNKQNLILQRMNERHKIILDKSSDIEDKLLKDLEEEIIQNQQLEDEINKQTITYSPEIAQEIYNEIEMIKNGLLFFGEFFVIERDEKQNISSIKINENKIEELKNKVSTELGKRSLISMLCVLGTKVKTCNELNKIISLLRSQMNEQKSQLKTMEKLKATRKKEFNKTFKKDIKLQNKEIEELSHKFINEDRAKTDCLLYLTGRKKTSISNSLMEGVKNLADEAKHEKHKIWKKFLSKISKGQWESAQDNYRKGIVIANILLNSIKEKETNGSYEESKELLLKDEPICNSVGALRAKDTEICIPIEYNSKDGGSHLIWANKDTVFNNKKLIGVESANSYYILSSTVKPLDKDVQLSFLPSIIINANTKYSLIQHPKELGFNKPLSDYLNEDTITEYVNACSGLRIKDKSLNDFLCTSITISNIEEQDIHCKSPGGFITLLTFFMYFKQNIKYPLSIPSEIRKIHYLLVSALKFLGAIMKSDLKFVYLYMDSIWLKDIDFDQFNKEQIKTNNGDIFNPLTSFMLAERGGMIIANNDANDEDRVLDNIMSITEGSFKFKENDFTKTLFNKLLLHDTFTQYYFFDEIEDTNKKVLDKKVYQYCLINILLIANDYNMLRVSSFV